MDKEVNAHVIGLLDIISKEIEKLKDQYFSKGYSAAEEIWKAHNDSVIVGNQPKFDEQYYLDELNKCYASIANKEDKIKKQLTELDKRDNTIKELNEKIKRLRDSIALLDQQIEAYKEEIAARDTVIKELVKPPPSRPTQAELNEQFIKSLHPFPPHPDAKK